MTNVGCESSDARDGSRGAEVGYEWRCVQLGSIYGRRHSTGISDKPLLGPLEGEKKTSGTEELLIATALQKLRRNC